MTAFFLFMGHAIQVFHFVLLLGVPFICWIDFDRLWWINYAWIVLVIAVNLIFGGCPVTILSNQYFELAGVEPYSNMCDWIAGAF